MFPVSLLLLHLTSRNFQEVLGEEEESHTAAVSYKKEIICQCLWITDFLFSFFLQLLVAGLKFFLGADEFDEKDEDSDSENEMVGLCSITIDFIFIQHLFIHQSILIATTRCASFSYHLSCTYWCTVLNWDLFIYSSVHLSAYGPFIYLFIHPLICFSFIYSFIYQFIKLFICSFIQSFIISISLSTYPFIVRPTQVKLWNNFCMPVEWTRRLPRRRKS